MNSVGVQSDVTARVLADREREQAHRAEREARADAESARADAEQSAGAADHARRGWTSLLAATLDADRALDQLSPTSWCRRWRTGA